jgi:predicted dehydrogenase
MVETLAQPAKRIAVIGAGGIGRRHAELVVASDRASLSAIVDPDPSAAAFARDLDVPWIADVRELLSDGRADGAIIATPNPLHAEHAVACLSAGVPTLVEKPIAATVADGELIAFEAERVGVPVLVGHHRRHSPFLAEARRLIADGGLGRIVAASATTMFAKPATYFDSAPWRREPGGGPILINLIHDIDALRVLVGDVAQVHAVASNVVRGQPVEESVSVSLRFVGGAVGSMLLSDAAAAPVSWEMTSGEDLAYPRYPHRDSYVIAGTRGTLGIPSMRLTVAEGSASWHEPMLSSTLDVSLADPLARQLDHFIDIANGTASPACPGRDGVESLRVTLAIAEAAVSGRSVDCAPALSMP